MSLTVVVLSPNWPHCRSGMLQRWMTNVLHNVFVGNLSNQVRQELLKTVLDPPSDKLYGCMIFNDDIIKFGNNPLISFDDDVIDGSASYKSRRDDDEKIT